jgi:hypothetical protein
MDSFTLVTMILNEMDNCSASINAYETPHKIDSKKRRKNKRLKGIINDKTN